MELTALSAVSRVVGRLEDPPGGERHVVLPRPADELDGQRQARIAAGDPVRLAGSRNTKSALPGWSCNGAGPAVAGMTTRSMSSTASRYR